MKFVEDAAVPLEHLATYVREMKKILHALGVKASFFGHAGHGHIHLNPRLNPRDPEDQRKIRHIYDAQTQLTLSLGGTVSGEHGDGLLRTRAVRRQYGPLIEIFENLKGAMDPSGLLNPGKILHPDPEAPFRQWQYALPKKALKAPFLEQVDLCHGCGECRHYCPVFQENPDEISTGRAKAHLIRGWLAGDLEGSDPILDQALKLCGDCNLCLEQCPTRIDIAQLCKDTNHLLASTPR